MNDTIQKQLGAALWQMRRKIYYVIRPRISLEQYMKTHPDITQIKPPFPQNFFSTLRTFFL